MLHVKHRSDLATMETPGGGLDLWNEKKLCHVAFAKYPEAVKIQYSIGSGLYVYFTYTTKDGQELQGKIYDGLDDKYLGKK